MDEVSVRLGIGQCATVLYHSITVTVETLAVEISNISQNEPEKMSRLRHTDANSCVFPDICVEQFRNARTGGGYIYVVFCVD